MIAYGAQQTGSGKQFRSSRNRTLGRTSNAHRPPRSPAGEFDTLHFHIDHLHFPHFRSERGRTLTMLHGKQDLADHMQLYQRFSDVGFHLARYGQVVCAGSRHIVEGLRVSLSKVPQWRFLRTSLHPAFEGLTGLI
jgi:hypothetical protein